jgi:anti-sigma28 factor (negative regulator of flagellin synthesis)
MDDIFIFAHDELTLTENTKKVLTRLQENDLFLKPAKCEFNKTKVEYLGMVIQEGKISMDPGKLKEYGTGQHQLRSNRHEDF